MAPPNFLEYLVISCFERRCPKLNTVARLKSKDLAQTKILGWLRHCLEHRSVAAACAPSKSHAQHIWDISLLIRKTAAGYMANVLLVFLYEFLRTR